MTDKRVEKLRLELEDKWKGFLKTNLAALELRFEKFPPSASNTQKRTFEKKLSTDCKEVLKKKLGSPVFYSISHTQNHEGVWILAAGHCINSRQPVSVGVDWEYKDRKTHPELGRRISQSSEKSSHLNALEIWTIKEACYKANPKNKGTVLKQYRITNSDQVITQNQEILRFQLLRLESFVLVFATTLQQA